LKNRSKYRTQYITKESGFINYFIVCVIFVLIVLGCGRKGNPHLANELIVLGNISLTAERAWDPGDKDSKRKPKTTKPSDLNPLKISCTRESQSELIARLERKFISKGEDKFSEIAKFKTPTFSFADTEMVEAATADYRIIFETPSGSKVGVTDTLRVISAGGELYFERFTPN